MRQFDIVNIHTGAIVPGVFCIYGNGRVCREIAYAAPGYPNIEHYAIQDVDLDECKVVWRKE